MSKDKLLVGILGAFLGFGLVSFLIGTIGFISQPYGMIPGEGLYLFQANLVAEGGSLYNPVTSTQYMAVPYPPLYMLVCGWLSSIFGSSLLIGRLVSLVSGVGVVLGIYLITSRLTKSRVVGALAGMLLVSTYIFRFLSPLYRIDMLGMVFSILGIYLALRFENRGKLIYWTIPLFLLAFFTKQYYLAGPIAVCIYLLVKGHWRIGSSLKYGGFYLGLLAVCFLIGGLLTNWELIIHSFLYVGASNRMAWVNLVGSFRQYALFHTPIILGVLGYFGYKLYKRKSLILVDSYFLVGLVAMIVATGHIGGTFHYGLEVTVIGCVMVGLLLNKGIQVFREGSPKLKPVLLGGGVFVLACLQILGFPLGQGLLTYQFLDTAEEANKEVILYLSDVDGRALSDRLSYTAEQVEGSPDWILYEPAMLFVGRLYEKEGSLGWDQTELVRRLETGYYELIVTPDPLREIWIPGTETLLSEEGIEMYRERLSVEVSSAMMDNYDLVLESDWMGTNFCPYKTYIFRYGEWK